MGCYCANQSCPDISWPEAVVLKLQYVFEAHEGLVRNADFQAPSSEIMIY